MHHCAPLRPRARDVPEHDPADDLFGALNAHLFKRAHRLLCGFGAALEFAHSLALEFHLRLRLVFVLTRHAIDGLPRDQRRLGSVAQHLGTDGLHIVALELGLLFVVHLVHVVNPSIPRHARGAVTELFHGPLELLVAF